ncbi:C47 family peptidase [Staphylococcus epidermidis]|nr:C47 family peptidase [Staphylococcus epidermidis]
MEAGDGMGVGGNGKVKEGEEVILIWKGWENGLMSEDGDSNMIGV